MLRKGPEHIPTPNRHKYGHLKTQEIGAKIPVTKSDDSQEQKNLKISKFSILCLCTYILTMGWEMLSTDVLDPKELRKRFRDGSHVFQGYFRKLGFGILESH